MKKIFTMLCVVLAGTTMLTSCLSSNDDDDVTTYADMAITNFALSAVNRYTQSTSSSTGNDTIIKTTLTASNYKMTIDQLGHRIYNQDLLPSGSDLKHILCTISTKNSGVVALQSTTSDSLQWFSSTDSIDFTQPRIFRVYAIDGSGYRDYTVSVTASPTEGTTFGWQLEKTDDALAGWTDKVLVAQGDSVKLVERDSIVGASTTERYMFSTTDGTLQYSADGGTIWQQERLDADDALLPTAATAACVSWPYAPADNTDYVLMVGTPRQADATTMRVWRKISPYEGGGQWVYMPFDDDNTYVLPRQDYIALTVYDGTVLAVGTDLVVRQSRDQGISWHTNSTYALPSALNGTRVAIATAADGRLFLVSDAGELWIGMKR